MDITTKPMVVTSQPGVQLHTSTSLLGSLKVTPERPHSFIGALQSSGQGLLDGAAKPPWAPWAPLGAGPSRGSLGEIIYWCSHAFQGGLVGHGHPTTIGIFTGSC